MKYVLSAMLLCLAFAAGAKNGKMPRSLMKDSLPAMTERCEKVLKAAYMEGTLLEVNKKLEGWEGYPVRLYEYYTGYDSTACGPKKGKVYLLNPSPEKLAKWIMTAVWEVKGNLDFQYTEKLRKQILYQSGAQFPVSGVVYEAMYKKGDYYPYLFKNGVSVWLLDASLKNPHPDEKLLDFYLNMKYSDLKPNVGTYARICSTTPDQYLAAGGTEDIGSGKNIKQHWLDVVRELYKKAWKSDRNELMVIWCKANL